MQPTHRASGLWFHSAVEDNMLATPHTEETDFNAWTRTDPEGTEEQKDSTEAIEPLTGQWGLWNHAWVIQWLSLVTYPALTVRGVVSETPSHAQGRKKWRVKKWRLLPNHTRAEDDVRYPLFLKDKCQGAECVVTLRLPKHTNGPDQKRKVAIRV
ncbi:uncharacterized protein LAJ45_04843 [Morchella importuna]|uniref:uncharacterized protein n=1 Tax=Morchella importuna TaxID=1174673 RepID=UPI001E8E34F2|nr:uncharacterized protein LAJ45_04843 [Morchella importuna]KAH8151141.1 hypothetical protein LAJ45_04843 [Morchella importuna]